MGIEEGRRVAQAISDAGVPVESVYDLVNSDRPYPNAVPVLVRLLENGIEDERVAEGVVRALAVKEAKGVAGPALVSTFRRAPQDRWTYKWAIGNTLYAVADEQVIPEIISLVRDRRHGRAREMLVETLGRFRTPDATAALIELVQENDLVLHAIRALGKHQAEEARDHIARYLNDPRPAVKRAAERTLAKLNKKVGKRTKQ
jgi:HEAT repeat protein